MLNPDFFKIPKQIYENDSHYIPENESSIQRLFSRDNPYFENGEAEVFVMPGKHRLVGFFSQAQKEKWAFFGYFESIDDLQALQKSFGAFEKWAKSQGATEVFGPINFNTFGNYRLKLNFKENEGCFIGEPYNPHYYPKLLERLGYQVAHKYCSLVVRDDFSSRLRQTLDARSDFVDFLPDPSFSIVPMTPDFWMGRLDELYSLVDETFAQNFAYQGISKEAFVQACGKPFAHKLCPKLSACVLDGNDEIASFFLVNPDYAGLVCQGAQKRKNPDDISYVEDFPRLNRPKFLAKTLGTKPKYRKLGLLNILGTRAATLCGDDYRGTIICLMKDGNHSIRYVEPFAEHIRWYGLFAKKV